MINKKNILASVFLFCVLSLHSQIKNQLKNTELSVLDMCLSILPIRNLPINNVSRINYNSDITIMLDEKYDDSIKNILSLNNPAMCLVSEQGDNDDYSKNEKWIRSWQTCEVTPLYQIKLEKAIFLFSWINKIGTFVNGGDIKLSVVFNGIVTDTLLLANKQLIYPQHEGNKTEHFNVLKYRKFSINKKGIITIVDYQDNPNAFTRAYNLRYNDALKQQDTIYSKYNIERKQDNSIPVTFVTLYRYQVNNKGKLKQFYTDKKFFYNNIAADFYEQENLTDYDLLNNFAE